MTHTVSITYLPCQTCHAKVHCDECEKQLEQALMRIQNINGASVQMAEKKVLVDGPIDPDTLEEAMEDLGLFVG